MIPHLTGWNEDRAGDHKDGNGYANGNEKRGNTPQAAATR